MVLMLLNLSDQAMRIDDGVLLARRRGTHSATDLERRLNQLITAFTATNGGPPERQR